MRYVVVGLVIGMAGSAGADLLPESAYAWRKHNTSGTLLEIGGGWQQTHPDGITYRAEYLRFAPQVSLNRFLYLGAALQVGHIYSASGMRQGVYIPPDSSYVEESTGTTFAPQVVLGSRGIIDIFSGAVELAPTVRWTSASADYLYLITTSSVTTLELHARADVWPTPHFSAGVMAGVDTASLHDFMCGVQIAFHFEPYDTMARR